MKIVIDTNIVFSAILNTNGKIDIWTGDKKQHNKLLAKNI